MAELIDCPAAPLDDDENEPERPDPYDVEIDRQAEVRDVQQDMSRFGRDLFEHAQTITAVYRAGMKAGQR